MHWSVSLQAIRHWLTEVDATMSITSPWKNRNMQNKLLCILLSFLINVDLAYLAVTRNVALVDFFAGNDTGGTDENQDDQDKLHVD